MDDHHCIARKRAKESKLHKKTRGKPLTHSALLTTGKGYTVFCQGVEATRQIGCTVILGRFLMEECENEACMETLDCNRMTF